MNAQPEKEIMVPAKRQAWVGQEEVPAERPVVTTRIKKKPSVVSSKKSWKTRNKTPISPYSRPQSAEHLKRPSSRKRTMFNRRPKSAACPLDYEPPQGRNNNRNVPSPNGRPISSLDTVPSPRCFSRNSVQSIETSVSSFSNDPQPVKAVTIVTERPRDKLCFSEDRSSRTSSPLPRKKCKTKEDYQRERFLDHDKKMSSVEASFRKHGTDIHSVMEVLKAYGYSRPMSSARLQKKIRPLPKFQISPPKKIHQDYSHEQFESTK